MDCHDIQHRVYTFEDFTVHPQGYNLDKFFELWMNAVDILSYEPTEVEEVEIINPFTGKKEIVSKRRQTGGLTSAWQCSLKSAYFHRKDIA